jgi:hypothetical protein
MHTPSSQIFVTCRDVYGTEKFYPSCKTAQLFAAIAGTKTLTPQVLNLIEKAGYQIMNTDRGRVGEAPPAQH